MTYLSEPWLGPHIPTGELALDVGANEGYFSYYLLDHFDEVIAFEPNPMAAAAIRRHFGGVTLIEKAVGEETGRLQLDLFADAQHTTAVAYPVIRPDMNLEGRGERLGQMTVPVVRLDTLRALSGRKIDFMKIDVEGWEREVIRGASRLLRKWHPTVIVEVHYVAQGKVEPLLRDLGYKLEKVLHPEREKAPEFYWTYWLVAT